MSNPYKFNSVEYRLHQAAEAVGQALEGVKKFRVEKNPIKEISCIGFGTPWQKPRIESPKSWESYGGFDSSYWRSFDKERKDHIDQCYNGFIKYYEAALAEVEKWHTENLPLIEHNKNVKESVANFMAMIGVPATYHTNEPVGRRGNTKSVEKAAGYVEDLGRHCRVNDNYESVLRQLKDKKNSADNWKKGLLAEIVKKEEEKKKNEKYLRLLARSLELAKEWNITCEDNSQLIMEVQDRAEQKYREELEAQDEPLHHKCCDDCSSWDMGSNRCSCGNVRLELSIEGNILDGLYHYVSRY